MLRTLGGMTIVLERAFRQKYSPDDFFKASGEISNNAASLEIETLLRKVSGQSNSAISKRIADGFATIDGDLL